MLGGASTFTLAMWLVITFRPTPPFVSICLATWGFSTNVTESAIDDKLLLILMLAVAPALSERLCWWCRWLLLVFCVLVVTEPCEWVEGEGGEEGERCDDVLSIFFCTTRSDMSEFGCLVSSCIRLTVSRWVRPSTFSPLTSIRQSLTSKPELSANEPGMTSFTMWSEKFFMRIMEKPSSRTSGVFRSRQRRGNWWGAYGAGLCGKVWVMIGGGSGGGCCCCCCWVLILAESGVGMGMGSGSGGGGVEARDWVEPPLIALSSRGVSKLLILININN